MNRWIRQFHRWVSIVFTLAVVANFVALARGGEVGPPEWVTYSPLAPLAVLVVTGLWLFGVPYVARWRRGGRAGVAGETGSRRRGSANRCAGANSSARSYTLTASSKAPASGVRTFLELNIVSSPHFSSPEL